MSINTFVALPLMRNCNLLRLPKRQLECREAIALLRLFFTRADGGVAASPARRFSFDVPDCPHTRIVLKYIAFQFSISLAAQFTFFFYSLAAVLPFAGPRKNTNWYMAGEYLPEKDTHYGY